MLKSGKLFSAKAQGAKRVVRKSTLAVLIAITFMLVFGAAPDSSFVEDTGAVAMNIVSPIVSAAKWPFEKISGFYKDIAYFEKVDMENEKLALENRALRDRLAEYQARSHEVELATKACRYADSPAWKPITARVAGAGSSGFSRSFVLNAGSNLGVKKSQPATVNGYFVGQISSIGEKYSRLLLITDPASRISVKLSGSGGRAFLFGNGTPYARLRHFEKEGLPELGDTVLTSGLDENVPPGIPVGIVGAIDNDNNVLVQPFVAASDIEVVAIIASSRAAEIREFLKAEAP